MDNDRFELLFDAWAESRLTKDEASELSALLRHDPAARARFKQAAAFHGHLHAAADSFSLESVAEKKPVEFPSRPLGLSLVASLLAVGLTVSSFGWLMAARTHRTEVQQLGVSDGGFDAVKGALPRGFPSVPYRWSGDPCEVVAAEGRSSAVRFVEAEGEANVPNGRKQSCDIFQIIDLREVRDQLLSSGEAYAELQAELRDARPAGATPVRFIAKVYVFEGTPDTIIGRWPTTNDQSLGSGAQFRVTQGGKTGEWRTTTAKCVLPPDAGFLVIQIGVGNAGAPGRNSPPLGQQYVDDVRLRLITRHGKFDLAAR